MTGRKGERSSGEQRGGQQGILPWGFRSRRPSTRRSGFGLRLTVACGGRKSLRGSGSGFNQAEKKVGNGEREREGTRRARGSWRRGAAEPRR